MSSLSKHYCQSMLWLAVADAAIPVWNSSSMNDEQSYWTVQLGWSLAVNYSRRCLSGCPRSFLVAAEINKCDDVAVAQSAEYDRRVANISLFVYIGIQVPGSSRQSFGYSRHSPSRLYIYIFIYIYQYVMSFFPSNVHLSHILVPNVWSVPRGIGPHKIYFLRTIYYKLRHAGCNISELN